ncbi:hypothetical protein GOEFS_121_00440 [Gordonia effusa NBRC 100432]|uniref:Glucitol operon activator n=1 Tax=Gordonia effusa NBRC 100432 TaxID=1077974 RepID=H0R6E1_9ACTN|nr:hypothetical protein [Gordonia effusa]GAB20642.1 hypothetical protein GOEFS_121_00440 [Gordonia effusa NBRC 100432]
MQSQPQSAPRRRHRPALIVLTLVAALACLVLAWWQWDRYESASGTAQNLGYALQWPAFAIAVIYAYRRFVVLESSPEEQAKIAADARGATTIPDGLLPDRPTTPSASAFGTTSDPGDDADLVAYNHFLKNLNNSDRSSAERGTT